MRSMFSRQVAQITVLLLVTLTVLGLALQVGLNTFLSQRQKRTLSVAAEAVADMSRAYRSAEELADSWDFRMSASLASRVSDTETVICGTDGQVLVCACDEFACRHLQSRVPEDFVRSVLESGSRYLSGPLSGVYEENRYVQALALSSHSGDVMGLVIVSAPRQDMTDFLHAMLRVFLFIALGVWITAVLVTLAISRHETKPLKEMAKTVSRFGHGDLTARARLGHGNSSEMDELAASFNVMADTLEKSEKLRSEFVANISHELKTPMTSIAGYLDGMLDGTIPKDRHEHYMRIVTDEVRRLSRLVRTMLEISRMQADGVDESQMTRFDLVDAVTQALLTFENAIRQRRLEVEVDVPDKVLYTTAHRDSIVQVVSNLVDNAVKFANDCGYLTISVKVHGAKAHVTVKNTGPVIPAKELPFIFARFHKLDKSRSKDPTGVGLGLYIVKTIIGAHGEEIWVESHDGVTAFTFTLPAEK